MGHKVTGTLTLRKLLPNSYGCRYEPPILHKKSLYELAEFRQTRECSVCSGPR